MQPDISVGAILIDPGGRLVFAVQRVGRWFERNQQLYAYYTGIGGNLDPGENLEACLVREALEETSACVKPIMPVHPTLFIDGDRLCSRSYTDAEQRLLGKVAPLAIYQMHFHTPEAGRSQTCLVPIYLTVLASLDEGLKAQGDIPALIALTLEQVRHFQSGVRMDYLRRSGLVISINRDNRLPDRLILLPFAEAYLITAMATFANSVALNIQAYTAQP